MSNILRKTFGGLTRAYYMRQLFFGACVAAFVLAIGYGHVEQPGGHMLFLVVMSVVNTVLYPYARFAYVSVVSCIMGETMIISSMMFAMIWKLLSIAII